MTSDTTAKALQLIQKERENQIAKWGDQNDNPMLLWLSILVEEVGELSEAIYETEHLTAHSKPERGGYEAMLHESIHVAAVAAAIIESLSKRMEVDTP